MAISSDTRKRWAWITATRGALMFLAGLYALLFPAAALAVVVIATGILLVVDGALGLWSLTFGGAKTGNFWFDIARNALELVTGLLILIVPLVATGIAAVFLVYLFAFQAILVGVMEIVYVTREREAYARIWPVLLSGALYIILGLLLILSPFISSIILVSLAGALMVIYALGLFGLAWRMYRAARDLEGEAGSTGAPKMTGA